MTHRNVKLTFCSHTCCCYEYKISYNNIPPGPQCVFKQTNFEISIHFKLAATGQNPTVELIFPQTFSISVNQTDSHVELQGKFRWSQWRVDAKWISRWCTLSVQSVYGVCTVRLFTWLGKIHPLHLIQKVNHHYI